MADISNKIPISSEREREGKKRILGSFRQWEAILLSLLVLLPLLGSNSPLILEWHKRDLQNRLTLFISSVCYNTFRNSEALPIKIFFMNIYGIEGLMGIKMNAKRALSTGAKGMRNHPGPTLNCTHPILNLHAKCRVPAKCESSVPGMT